MVYASRWWNRHRTLVVLGSALGLALSGRAALAAGAVFDAEYWQASATHGVEVLVDPLACFDTFAELRRSIRATAADNVAGWELRVGSAADAGAYVLWAHLAVPAGSTRTLLVGQDIAGQFEEPADRFTVTGGGGDYFWARVTRQGTGSASDPEDDPWPLQLSTTATILELRLVETDILLDRLAVSNVGGYVPPDCPVDGDDGGPADGGPVGDEPPYVNAVAAGCTDGEFYDRVSQRCRRAQVQSCAATKAALVPAAVLPLLAVARRGSRRRASLRPGSR